VPRGSILRLVEWLLFGAAAAGVCDALIAAAESLLVAARDAGSLPPTLALGLSLILVGALATLATLLAGDRTVAGVLLSAAFSAVAYIISGTHLAAVSIGLSVAMFGERAHRPAPSRSQPPADPATPPVPRRRTPQRQKKRRAARREPRPVKAQTSEMDQPPANPARRRTLGLYLPH
jgi:hypothetical protein